MQRNNSDLLLDQLQNDVTNRLLRVLKTVEIKDPAPGKSLSSFIMDSLHFIEVKLAIENEFSDPERGFSLILEDRDDANLFKMNLNDLAVHISNKLSEDNFETAE